MKSLNITHYGGNPEKVLLAHEKLLQLQKDALASPPLFTFEDVAVQETVLFELSAVKEAFLRQKSRVKWLNEGDQNSKYFHRVIKGRQTKMKIVALQNDYGSALTDEHDIISEFLKFYIDFIDTANSDCNGGTEDFFNLFILPLLPLKCRTLCCLRLLLKKFFTL